MQAFDVFGGGQDGGDDASGGAAASARGPRQRQAAAGPGGAADTARVLFSCCMGETHTHRAGFRQLYRRLRSAYRPEKLEAREDMCLEVLLGPAASGLAGGEPGGASGPAVLVLGCPRQPFTAAEFETLRAFLRGGGSLLVALAEGGEAAAGTNINYLLEECGITANADAVLRTSHHKYLHPKEALIGDGLLNRALLGSGGGGSGAKAAASAWAGGGGGGGGAPGGRAGGGAGRLEFVYPRGCTLSVQAPAVPVLSSGRISYPMQQPLAACWSSPEAGGGRLLAIGSAGVFDDAFLDREDNSKISDFAFRWLCPGSKLELHPGDAGDPDVSRDLMLLPDTEALADRPKPCLAEVAELPRDWARLFDGQLYSVDMRHVPAVVALYSQLGVPKAPLGLIPPTFEVPLPPLAGATFPPVPHEPPPPGLELFDLDDALAGPQAQLSSLLARCKGGADDLEYFLLEAAQLTGLETPPEAGAKGVLAELLRRIVDYRMAGALGGADGPQLDGSSGGWGRSPAEAGQHGADAGGGVGGMRASRSPRATDLEL